MNEQTKYMYIYRHDGGDYIGCRIQGLNCDCQYDSEEEVDCENCKYNDACINPVYWSSL